MRPGQVIKKGMFVFAVEIFSTGERTLHTINISVKKDAKFVDFIIMMKIVIETTKDLIINFFIMMTFCIIYNNFQMKLRI